MGARNRVGIGMSYRPARLHRLAESISGIDSWAPKKFLGVKYLEDVTRDPGYPSFSDGLGSKDFIT
jgi:hypothetical protein